VLVSKRLILTENLLQNYICASITPCHGFVVESFKFYVISLFSLSKILTYTLGKIYYSFVCCFRIFELSHQQLQSNSFRNALRNRGNTKKCFSCKANGGRLLSHPTLLLFGTTSIGLTTYYRLHITQPILCEGRSNTSLGRTMGYSEERHNIETQFPWREFMKLLIPDIWHFVGAVLVRSTVDCFIFISCYSVILLILTLLGFYFVSLLIETCDLSFMLYTLLKILVDMCMTFLFYYVHY
jgi:hypothetical protein